MRLLLSVLLLGLPLPAAELTGIWVGRLNGKDIAFQFSQKGNTLNGKLYGDYRSTPIVEGKVSSDEFTFVVIAEEQSGNQINQTRLLFSGKLKNGQLDLKRRRESSTNAGNSGDSKPRGGQPEPFTLKRLL
ncbi:MAG: hypothetical protein IT168_27600 [Bryobacterales bacterium]|nr:hypothetical protein [Bryobacterales bacterium]